MSKRTTKKVVSLSVLVAMVMGMVVSLMPAPAMAASVTNASDLMTRLQVSVASSHDISFDMDASTSFATTETITFDFDEDGSMFTVDGASSAVADFDFNDGTERTVYAVGATADCTGSTGADDVAIGVNDTSGLVTVLACGSFTASSAGATVNLEYGSAAGGSERVTNPSAAASYELNVAGTFGDTGIIEIPIVDDDTVNVTGFIDTSITFDIDTSETDEDCDAAGGTTPCDAHAGASDNVGYVVDLGELTSTAVNVSGGTSVYHADGLMGQINFIWFDLATNADGGAVVTVDSLNGSLYMDATNSLATVSGNGAIASGSGLYGLREEANSTTTGAFTIASDYDGTGTNYGEASQSSATIFDTSSAPLTGGRVQFSVAAAADGLEATGTYTDELTFIATGTF